jgi:hypothetical protein
VLAMRTAVEPAVRAAGSPRNTTSIPRCSMSPATTCPPPPPELSATAPPRPGAWGRGQGPAW